MNAEQLKASRVEQAHEADLVRRLREEFIEYIKCLRETRAGGDGVRLRRVGYALGLRLEREEYRFSEWHRGHQMLNPYVFGLLKDVDAFADDDVFEETVARAMAKFDLLVEVADGELRKVDSQLAGLGAPLSVVVTREGFFGKGQEFDATRSVQELIKTAAKSIVVVDGYVDETLLDILASKRHGVTVSILTKAKSATSGLAVAARTFAKQHGSTEVRSEDSFHDRFIILDGAEFYHFGASLKDVGKRGFMFSRIEEPAVVSTIRSRFDAAWTAATVVV